MGGAAAVVGNLVTTGISSMMSGSSPAEAPASTDNPKASSGQGAVNADPNAPVGGGMKNPDGSPMTNAQISAAMDRVAPVAGSATDPNKYYNSLDPAQKQATDDAVYAQAKASGATGEPWRTMNTGPIAGGVPIGSTPDGINRLTGQPISSGPSWDQMTLDQQAATIAKQQQQAADVAQGTQNAKDYWANKPAYTRGLKESFAESTYVDKQATLKMWLNQEAHGLAVSGLALKPAVKEGIMDSLKGMFGGKKDAAATASARGVTADALNKAWTNAGSPTDSEEVAKVLQGAGIPAETVTKIFTDLKLPAPTGKVEPTLNPEQPGEQPAGQEANSEQPGEPAAMKSDDIVGQLKGFWDKVTANQENPTSSPQVQQQLIAMAKGAGLATQTFESKVLSKKTKAVRFINK
jgi:hypothetical protein